MLAGLVGPAKGKAGLPPGPVSAGGDDDRVWRIDRAHLNAVETLASFTVPAVLAILVGLGPLFLGVLVWAQVLLRLGFSVVYVRGGPLAATGNLRTTLFVLSSGVTIVLVLATAWRAVT